MSSGISSKLFLPVGVISPTVAGVSARKSAEPSWKTRAVVLAAADLGVEAAVFLLAIVWKKLVLVDGSWYLISVQVWGASKISECVRGFDCRPRNSAAEIEKLWNLRKLSRFCCLGFQW